MSYNFNSLLYEVPESTITDYLSGVALLLNVQRTNASSRIISDQERVVRNRRRRLMYELEQREIVVSLQELSAYLIQRGIDMYREEQARYNSIVGDKTPEELWQDIDINNVDRWMKFVGPEIEEESFRLLVEKTLQDEVQL